MKKYLTMDIGGTEFSVGQNFREYNLKENLGQYYG